MPIEVRCPNGHLLHVREKHAGKIGLCPRCAAPVMVPQLGQPAPGPVRPKATPSSPPVRPADDSVLGESSSDRPTSISDSTLSSTSSIMLRGRLCLSCCRMVSQSFSMCPQCGTSVIPYRNLTARREGDAIALLITKPRIVDDVAVNEIAGELCNAADRAEPRNIVLDFAKVAVVSSLMLGRLVMFQTKLRQAGRLLALWNLLPEVRDVLAATKLDRVLHIREG